MSAEFPELTENWFAENGCTDPSRAVELWSVWQTPHRNAQASYRKALTLASGLSPGAIRHYLHGRTYKLAETTLARLDAITGALHFVPPPRKERKGELIRSSLVDRRLTLLTPLTEVPSLSFYMEMIRSISHAAAKQNFALTLHDVSQPVLATSLQQIVRHYRPSAVIMVRLTPDPDSVRVLQKWMIPAVLVHADRLRYTSPPVLANVVPAQDTLRTNLQTWAATRLIEARSTTSLSSSGSEVVVVSMQNEPETLFFEAAGKAPTSVRGQRKALALAALRDFNPILVEVEDYSFRHAWRIVANYPHAYLYVCLSDDIAVGIKHLLQISGQAWQNRIIGFDDSLLARQEQITSFSQQLVETGEATVSALRVWFEQMINETGEWPDFREITMKTSLQIRD